MLQNDVIKCCKMMSSNVALLHSNNCCVLEPAICEDLDLHVVIFLYRAHLPKKMIIFKVAKRIVYYIPLTVDIYFLAVPISRVPCH